MHLVVFIYLFIYLRVRKFLRCRLTLLLPHYLFFLLLELILPEGGVGIRNDSVTVSQCPSNVHIEYSSCVLRRNVPSLYNVHMKRFRFSVQFNWQCSFIFCEYYRNWSNLCFVHNEQTSCGMIYVIH